MTGGSTYGRANHNQPGKRCLAVVLVGLRGRFVVSSCRWVTGKKADHVPGRLVVRKIPDLAPKADKGQTSLFDLWRHHAFFTTTPPEVADTVTADKVHRVVTRSSSRCTPT
jgi:hypothetical protein